LGQPAEHTRSLDYHGAAPVGAEVSMTWVLIVAGVGLAAVLTSVVYVLGALLWLRQQTVYDAYFKRPLAERRAVKAQVARQARRVLAVTRRIPRWIIPDLPTRVYGGVHLPTMVCPRRRVELALSYRPDARDVFVATQMKCGTTWGQQIVYEVLMRGRGDLGDTGHGHMYAMSPWIESCGSVRLEDAAPIGSRPHRIIKTHLPASLCPYAESARYVYVVRHPVACFSSTVDFTQMLGGPFALDRARALDWYCSDEMWWGSWAAHVEGWWQWARTRPNVLVLHFEHMLDDLGAAVDQVAVFLDVELEADERARVVEKSGYAYMKAHEAVFEMSPPTFFSEGGTFFVSGQRGRERGAGSAERARILVFCREALAGASYPLTRYYPDIAVESAEPRAASV
jgi:hypothetical protein